MSWACLRGRGIGILYAESPYPNNSTEYMERFRIVVVVITQDTKIRGNGIMSSKGVGNEEIYERQRRWPSSVCPPVKGQG